MCRGLGSGKVSFFAGDKAGAFVILICVAQALLCLCKSVLVEEASTGKSAGSIKGNVKRKFFPLAARVSLFSAFSPFRPGRGRWQRRAWAFEDVKLGHMGTAFQSASPL